MLLQTKDLSFAYGTNDIFKNINIRIDEKDKIGLIGPNGSGKSTLIKLLTGQLEADSGSILKQNNLTIGYLEQTPTFDLEQSLEELYLSVFKHIKEKESRLRELEQLISADPENSQKLLKEYGNLQEFLHSDENYSYKSRIRGMIKGLGFSEEDYSKKIKEFSGGEKTKIHLGLELLKEPDLLFLDEPTNFLDLESLEWLESVLRNYPGSYLLVSHDRYFLDHVCNSIHAVSNYDIKTYDGNYTHYLEKHTEELINQDRAYKKAEREYNRQKAIIRRYRDINSKQSSKHARSREIALSKMTLPDKVSREESVHFSLKPSTRSGEDVLTASDLSKSYGNQKIFENISFEVKRGEKIGIIGANGIGKTTLLNILRRKEPKDSGKIDYGSKVRIGFFDQETRVLDSYQDYDLIETIQDTNPLLSGGEVRQVLAPFLFQGEDVFKKVSDLSGGEKARLKLAQLMLSESNFLLLDEPTNHIDMPTKEILENVLSEYEGTLLFVSHDRYFLNKVADKIFEFTPTGIEVYLGNYDAYIKRKTEGIEEEKQPTQTISKTQLREQRRKERKKQTELRTLRRELKTLEGKVEEATSKKQELELQMSQDDFYSDSEKSLEVINTYEQIKKEIDEYNELWEEKAIELEELEQ